MLKTKQEETTDWMIHDFPVSVKNKFMGKAMMEEKDWKSLLAHLMREYVRTK